MEIVLNVSEECEATDSPWWLIIDPRQNFKVDNQALHNINSMISGPFFSRAEAQRELDNRRYDYGRGAAVFCASGYHTHQYHNAMKGAGIATVKNEGKLLYLNYEEKK